MGEVFKEWEEVLKKIAEQVKAPEEVMEALEEANKRWKEMVRVGLSQITLPFAQRCLDSYFVA